jgi:hypothetical protein
MKKAQKDRKRQADFTSGSESSKQFRFVKKHTHGSSQSFPSGQWRMTSFQNKPSGNFQYHKNQQQVTKPKELPPRICYNCRQPRHYANDCPNPRQQKPHQQKQNPGSAMATTARSQAFKWSKANWISWVTSLIENTSLLCIVLSNLGTRFCLRGVGCDAPGF